MLSGISFVGALVSRFALRVVSAAVASICAGYLLTQLHVLNGDVERTTPVVYSPGDSDAPTAAEIRAQTRELLRARRENIEPPAEVKRTMKAAEKPVEKPAEKSADAKAADGKPAVAATPAAYTPAPALTSAAATPSAAMSSATMSSAAPAPGRPVATGAPPAPLGTTASRGRTGESMDSIGDAPPSRTASISTSVPSGAAALPPPVVAGPPPQSVAAASRANALPPVSIDSGRGDEEQSRSFAFHAFSAISTITGKGANAVGDSINWVGALPGRAISAGEKVFKPQPAQAPASPANPPGRSASN